MNSPDTPTPPQPNYGTRPTAPPQQMPYGQPQYAQPQPPYQAPQPPAAPKPNFFTRRWVQLTGVGLIALLVGVGIGGAGSTTDATSSSSSSTASGPTQADVDAAKAAGVTEGKAQAAAELKTREDAVAAKEAAVTAREAKVAGAEKAQAANTITEGTWTVGTDIKAGKYRTAEQVGPEGCYWEIDRSGTNGEDIVANDNVTGGRPTVTIKAGQDFTNHGCGDWTKIG